MIFEYTLTVMSAKNMGLEQITDQAAEALADAGVLAPGDYVENRRCGKLPTDEFPGGYYRVVAPSEAARKAEREQERWLESQRWTLVEEDGVYTLNLITPTFGGGGTVVRLTVVDEP